MLFSILVGIIAVFFFVAAFQALNDRSAPFSVRLFVFTVVMTTSLALAYAVRFI